MDRVSPLPDDLLLKILSYLPTNEVWITSVLSKRWRALWMLLPKLEYCCGNFNAETYESFSHFVNKSLLLHQVPVLESLHLSLEGTYSDTDIVSCLEIASNRNLHELNVAFGFLSCLFLPRRTCETLVVMHLSYVLLNVTLVPDSFKALETRHLLSMWYKGKTNESLTRLLSKCPVLEDLLID
ncbi:FBD-associated F-box protein [Raphanus sativus]|nr:FBD-associated F-box protein [Raphanus sativus]KAJ4900049.1 FBD-associated F-box protein [Raphanus sativus]